jgi:hypothetical protein
MMETENKNSQSFFYANAFIQLCAIFAFQQFGIVWPLYVIIVMLSTLIAMQTIAAAGAFSQIVPEKKVSTRPSAGINILVSVLYMISCYHIYIIGFVGFAWIAASHSVIHFFTNILGAMK